MSFKNSSQRRAAFASMAKYKRIISGRQYWYRSERIKGKPYPVSIYLGPANGD